MQTVSLGRALPAPSRADRNVPVSSKGHCVAHTVLGDGPGIHIQANSHLELCHLRLLQMQPNLIDLREQVNFYHGPQFKALHVFDFVATYRNGDRIAFTVKPEAKLQSNDFLGEMQVVAYWVEKQGFAQATRLLTDADIDRTDLHNAELLTTLHGADPEAEAIARKLASGFHGALSLRDLTRKLDLADRGYRALLRLIRSGELALFVRERITPSTLVSWKGTTR